MGGLSSGPGPGITLLIAIVLVLGQTASSAPLYDEDEGPESNSQALVESHGCYYNFQHYNEGERILTNEPCLNCTCRNRMLMCYLRVCPFTKGIGQNCTVEKVPGQCCPIVTCPEVPVQLLTSTTTEGSKTPGGVHGVKGTAVGHLDANGCNIDGIFYPNGAQVPGSPERPCELCYCIRNKTACIMQECALHVDGCRPVYEEGQCFPVRYQCDDSPYEEEPTTTVRPAPTPGLVITTTGSEPLDCLYNDEMYSDGSRIQTEDPCEHCYCLKGKIACAVQECGAPLEKEGQNCTALPPAPGKCCPDSYQCDITMSSQELTKGSDGTTEIPSTVNAGHPTDGYHPDVNTRTTENPNFTTDRMHPVSEGVTPSKGSGEQKPTGTTEANAQELDREKGTQREPTESHLDGLHSMKPSSTSDEGQKITLHDKDNAEHPGTTQTPMEKDHATDEHIAQVSTEKRPLPDSGSHKQDPNLKAPEPTHSHVHGNHDPTTNDILEMRPQSPAPDAKDPLLDKLHNIIQDVQAQVSDGKTTEKPEEAEYQTMTQGQTGHFTDQPNIFAHLPQIGSQTSTPDTAVQNATDQKVPEDGSNIINQLQGIIQGIYSQVTESVMPSKAPESGTHTSETSSSTPVDSIHGAIRPDDPSQPNKHMETENQEKPTGADTSGTHQLEGKPQEPLHPNERPEDNQHLGQTRPTEEYAGEGHRPGLGYPEKGKPAKYPVGGRPTGEQPERDKPSHYLEGSNEAEQKHPEGTTSTEEYLEGGKPTEEYPGNGKPSGQHIGGEEPEHNYPDRYKPGQNYPGGTEPGQKHPEEYSPTEEYPGETGFTGKYPEHGRPTEQHPGQSYPEGIRPTEGYSDDVSSTGQYPVDRRPGEHLPEEGEGTTGQKYPDGMSSTEEYPTSGKPTTEHFVTGRPTGDHPGTEKPTGQHSEAERPTQEYSGSEKPGAIYLDGVRPTEEYPHESGFTGKYPERPTGGYPHRFKPSQAYHGGIRPSETYPEGGRPTEDYSEHERPTEHVPEAEKPELHSEVHRPEHSYQKNPLEFTSTGQYPDDQSSTGNYPEFSSTGKYPAEGSLGEHFTEKGKPGQKYPDDISSSEEYPELNKQTEEYPEMGRPTAEHPGTGRPAGHHPEAEKPTGEYPGAGKPNEEYTGVETLTDKYPEAGRPTEEYPATGRPSEHYPGSVEPTQEHSGTRGPTGEYPGTVRPIGHHPEAEKPTGEHLGAGKPTGEYPESDRPTEYYPETDTSTGEYPGSGRPTGQHPKEPSVEGRPTGEYPEKQKHPEEFSPTEEYPGETGSTGKYPEHGRPTEQHPGQSYPEGVRPTEGYSDDVSSTGKYPVDRRPGEHLPEEGEGTTGQKYPDGMSSTEEYPTSGKPTTEHFVTGRPTGDHPGTEKPTGQHPEAERPTGDYPEKGKPTEEYPGSEKPAGEYPEKVHPSHHPEEHEPNEKHPEDVKPTEEYSDDITSTEKYPSSEKPLGQYPHRFKPGQAQLDGMRPTEEYPEEGKPTAQYPEEHGPGEKIPDGISATEEYPEGVHPTKEFSGAKEPGKSPDGTRPTEEYSEATYTENYPVTGRPTGQYPHRFKPGGEKPTEEHLESGRPSESQTHHHPEVELPEQKHPDRLSPGQANSDGLSSTEEYPTEKYPSKGQSTGKYPEGGEYKPSRYPEVQKPGEEYFEGTRPTEAYPESEKPTETHPGNKEPLGQHPEGGTTEQNPEGHTSGEKYPDGEKPIEESPEDVTSTGKYPVGERPGQFNAEGQKPNQKYPGETSSTEEYPGGGKPTEDSAGGQKPGHNYLGQSTPIEEYQVEKKPTEKYQEEKPSGHHPNEDTPTKDPEEHEPSQEYSQGMTPTEGYSDISSTGKYPVEGRPTEHYPQKYPIGYKPGQKYPDDVGSTEEYSELGKPTENYLETERPTGEYLGTGRPIGHHPEAEKPTGEHLGAGKPTGEYPESDRPTEYYPETDTSTGEYPGSGRPTGQHPEEPSVEGRPTGEYPEKQKHPEEYSPTEEYSGETGFTGKYPEHGRPTEQHPGQSYPEGVRPTEGYSDDVSSTGKYPVDRRPGEHLPEEGEGTTGQKYPDGMSSTEEYPTSGKPTTEHFVTGRPTGDHPGTEKPTGQHPEAGSPTGEYPEVDGPEGQYSGTQKPTGEYPEVGKPEKTESEYSKVTKKPSDGLKQPQPNDDAATTGYPLVVTERPQHPGGSHLSDNQVTEFGIPDIIGSYPGNYPSRPKPTETEELSGITEVPEKSSHASDDIGEGGKPQKQSSDEHVKQPQGTDPQGISNESPLEVTSEGSVADKPHPSFNYSEINYGIQYPEKAKPPSAEDQLLETKPVTDEKGSAKPEDGGEKQPEELKPSSEDHPSGSSKPIHSDLFEGPEKPEPNVEHPEGFTKKPQGTSVHPQKPSDGLHQPENLENLEKFKPSTGEPKPEHLPSGTEAPTAAGGSKESPTITNKPENLNAHPDSQKHPEEVSEHPSVLEEAPHTEHTGLGTGNPQVSGADADDFKPSEQEHSHGTEYPEGSSESPFEHPETVQPHGSDQPERPEDQTEFPGKPHATTEYPESGKPHGSESPHHENEVTGSDTEYPAGLRPGHHPEEIGRPHKPHGSGYPADEETERPQESTTGIYSERPQHADKYPGSGTGEPEDHTKYPELIGQHPGKPEDETKRPVIFTTTGPYPGATHRPHHSTGFPENSEPHGTEYPEDVTGRPQSGSGVRDKPSDHFEHPVGFSPTGSYPERPLATERYPEDGKPHGTEYPENEVSGSPVHFTTYPDEFSSTDRYPGETGRPQHHVGRPEHGMTGKPSHHGQHPDDTKPTKPSQEELQGTEYPESGATARPEEHTEHPERPTGQYPGIFGRPQDSTKHPGYFDEGHTDRPDLYRPLYPEGDKPQGTDLPEKLGVTHGSYSTQKYPEDHSGSTDPGSISYLPGVTGGHPQKFQPGFPESSTEYYGEAEKHTEEPLHEYPATGKPGASTKHPVDIMPGGSEGATESGEGVGQPEVETKHPEGIPSHVDHPLFSNHPVQGTSQDSEEPFGTDYPETGGVTDRPEAHPEGSTDEYPHGSGLKPDIPSTPDTSEPEFDRKPLGSVRPPTELEPDAESFGVQYPEPTGRPESSSGYPDKQKPDDSDHSETERPTEENKYSGGFRPTEYPEGSESPGTATFGVAHTQRPKPTGVRDPSEGAENPETTDSNDTGVTDTTEYSSENVGGEHTPRPKPFDVPHGTETSGEIGSDISEKPRPGYDTEPSGPSQRPILSGTEEPQGTEYPQPEDAVLYPGISKRPTKRPLKPKPGSEEGDLGSTDTPQGAAHPSEQEYITERPDTPTKYPGSKHPEGIKRQPGNGVPQAPGSEHSEERPQGPGDSEEPHGTEEPDFTGTSKYPSEHPVESAPTGEYPGKHQEPHVSSQSPDKQKPSGPGVGDLEGAPHLTEYPDESGNTIRPDDVKYPGSSEAAGEPTDDTQRPKPSGVADEPHGTTEKPDEAKPHSPDESHVSGEPFGAAESPGSGIPEEKLHGTENLEGALGEPVSGSFTPTEKVDVSGKPEDSTEKLQETEEPHGAEHPQATEMTGLPPVTSAGTQADDLSTKHQAPSTTPFPGTSYLPQGGERPSETIPSSEHLDENSLPEIGERPSPTETNLGFTDRIPAPGSPSEDVLSGLHHFESHQDPPPSADLTHLLGTPTRKPATKYPEYHTTAQDGQPDDESTVKPTDKTKPTATEFAGTKPDAPVSVDDYPGRPKPIPSGEYPTETSATRKPGISSTPIDHQPSVTEYVESSTEDDQHPGAPEIYGTSQGPVKQPTEGARPVGAGEHPGEIPEASTPSADRITDSMNAFDGPTTPPRESDLINKLHDIISGIQSQVIDGSTSQSSQEDATSHLGLSTELPESHRPLTDGSGRPVQRPQDSQKPSHDEVSESSTGHPTTVYDETPGLVEGAEGQTHKPHAGYPFVGGSTEHPVFLPSKGPEGIHPGDFTTTKSPHDEIPESEVTEHGHGSRPVDSENEEQSSEHTDVSRPSDEKPENEVFTGDKSTSYPSSTSVDGLPGSRKPAFDEGSSTTEPNELSTGVSELQPLVPNQAAPTQYPEDTSNAFVDLTKHPGKPEESQTTTSPLSGGSGQPHGGSTSRPSAEDRTTQTYQEIKGDKKPIETTDHFISEDTESETHRPVHTVVPELASPEHPSPTEKPLHVVYPTYYPEGVVTRKPGSKPNEEADKKVTVTPQTTFGGSFTQSSDDDESHTTYEVHTEISSESSTSSSVVIVQEVHTEVHSERATTKPETEAYFKPTTEPVGHGKPGSNEGYPTQSEPEENVEGSTKQPESFGQTPQIVFGRPAIIQPTGDESTPGSQTLEPHPEVLSSEHPSSFGTTKPPFVTITPAGFPSVTKESEHIMHLYSPKDKHPTSPPSPATPSSIHPEDDIQTAFVTDSGTATTHKPEILGTRFPSRKTTQKPTNGEPAFQDVITVTPTQGIAEEHSVPHLVYPGVTEQPEFALSTEGYPTGGKTPGGITTPTSHESEEGTTHSLEGASYVPYKVINGTKVYYPEKELPHRPSSVPSTFDGYDHIPYEIANGTKFFYPNRVVTSEPEFTSTTTSPLYGMYVPYKIVNNKKVYYTQDKPEKPETFDGLDYVPFDIVNGTKVFYPDRVTTTPAPGTAMYVPFKLIDGTKVYYPKDAQEEPQDIPEEYDGFDHVPYDIVNGNRVFRPERIPGHVPAPTKPLPAMYVPYKLINGERVYYPKHAQAKPQAIPEGYDGFDLVPYEVVNGTKLFYPDQVTPLLPEKTTAKPPAPYQFVPYKIVNGTKVYYPKHAQDKLTHKPETYDGFDYLPYEEVNGTKVFHPERVTPRPQHGSTPAFFSNGMFVPYKVVNNTKVFFPKDAQHKPRPLKPGYDGVQYLPYDVINGTKVFYPEGVTTPAPTGPSAMYVPYNLINGTKVYYASKATENPEDIPDGYEGFDFVPYEIVNGNKVFHPDRVVAPTSGMYVPYKIVNGTKVYYPNDSTEKDRPVPEGYEGIDYVPFEIINGTKVFYPDRATTTRPSLVMYVPYKMVNGTKVYHPKDAQDKPSTMSEGYDGFDLLPYEIVDGTKVFRPGPVTERPAPGHPQGMFVPYKVINGTKVYYPEEAHKRPHPLSDEYAGLDYVPYEVVNGTKIFHPERVTPSPMTAMYVPYKLVNGTKVYHPNQAQQSPGQIPADYDGFDYVPYEIVNGTHVFYPNRIPSYQGMYVPFRIVNGEKVFYPQHAQHEPSQTPGEYDGFDYLPYENVNGTKVFRPVETATETLVEQAMYVPYKTVNGTKIFYPKYAQYNPYLIPEGFEGFEYIPFEVVNGTKVFDPEQAVKPGSTNRPAMYVPFRIVNGKKVYYPNHAQAKPHLVPEGYDGFDLVPYEVVNGNTVFHPEKVSQPGVGFKPALFVPYKMENGKKVYQPKYAQSGPRAPSKVPEGYHGFDRLPYDDVNGHKVFYPEHSTPLKQAMYVPYKLANGKKVFYPKHGQYVPTQTPEGYDGFEYIPYEIVNGDKIFHPEQAVPAEPPLRKAMFVPYRMVNGTKIYYPKKAHSDPNLIPPGYDGFDYLPYEIVNGNKVFHPEQATSLEAPFKQAMYVPFRIVNGTKAYYPMHAQSKPQLIPEGYDGSDYLPYEVVNGSKVFSPHPPKKPTYLQGMYVPFKLANSTKVFYPKDAHSRPNYVPEGYDGADYVPYEPVNNTKMFYPELISTAQPDRPESPGVYVPFKVVNNKKVFYPKESTPFPPTVHYPYDGVAFVPYRASPSEIVYVEDDQALKPHKTTARPGYVPGEGSCYLNNQTFANNTEIPPVSPCQARCMCVSSVVRCVRVKCPSPPENKLDCSPVYREGSCCPSYACGDSDYEYPTTPGYAETKFPELLSGSSSGHGTDSPTSLPELAGQKKPSHGFGGVPGGDAGAPSEEYHLHKPPKPKPGGHESLEPYDNVEGHPSPEDDYDLEDEEPYGPGTCRYAGKVYVSAQQIPRDDPCDFCFCFRSDIICLQQSCPPPIPGCRDEPIQGFCCPRYECHVKMATLLNVTSTTTTTTTTLPPHFFPQAFKGQATKTGCFVQGRAYRVGQAIASASGPCMDCICGGNGRMKCEPKVCTPEPMIRKMISPSENTTPPAPSER